uniref:DUF834 domain-containing protein n=1 Tax=Oryza meridionalis TaxID=40149 RepID=A0A0E0CU88_9ORYZ
MADGRIWPARERWEECSEARSARRGAADGSGGRHGTRRCGRRWWRPACHEDAQPAAGGRLSAMRRCRRQRWPARRDEARPVVIEAGTVRGGGAAGGCDVVYDARRLAGGRRRCSGPTRRQRLDGGGALGRQPWTKRW